MDSKFPKLPKKVNQNGFSPERKESIRLDSCDPPVYEIPDNLKLTPPNSEYEYDDLSALQSVTPLHGSYNASIHSIDDLLERDKQREEDGFPRKIQVGRMIKPGRGGKDKIVVVPTTVEEKFIHDRSFKPSEEDPSGGSGEGEEGEVIGEQPVRGESGEGGAGEGGGGQHEMESSAYDLGRLLTEQFELPNLKDKGKKRSFTRYTYDMTDRHRGFGQILDKKATLRKIVETNISLGRLPDIDNIDPTRFLIAPHDKIYRILSREMDYESQALVFFLRDYSGSMFGKPTELVVSQHVLIYSWLLFQYARQVETRFILHDTDSTEVPDFYTYYNSKVAGEQRWPRPTAWSTRLWRRRVWYGIIISMYSTVQTAMIGIVTEKRLFPNWKGCCLFPTGLGSPLPAILPAQGRNLQLKHTSTVQGSWNKSLIS